jgi:UDP-glucose 4-epimerase
VRVLVTGARGFVGRAVVRNLIDHGHVAVARSRQDLDVRQPWPTWADVDPFDYDGVIHLAARSTVRESWDEPADYYLTNVGGVANLLLRLEGSPSAPTRIVFASTSAVYGPGREGRLSEDLPLQPGNPYAASKAAAEALLAFQARSFDADELGVTTLRLFNVAGALDGIVDPSETRIISNCLRAAAGEIPHVSINGDGSTRREFTHVGDVAEAFRLAVESTTIGEARTFNVGTGVGVSMAEVIETAKRVTGVDFKVVHNPPVDEPAELVADPSRAAADLRWRASASLERIVADAWQCRET